MKWNNWYWLLGMGIVVLAVISAYNAASAPLPEGFPPPTPDGKIEVKQYPAYRAATYTYQGKLSQAAESAFSPLYNHISSNNISMTAPVEARYPSQTLLAEDSSPGIGSVYVSFLYRRQDIKPEQVASNIQVEDIPPSTVISIGHQGSYSYQSYLDSLKKLNDWLAEHPQYRVSGPPRRLFYDGPYIPDPWKRSEVQIPVE